jgi:hypothetical protein
LQVVANYWTLKLQELHQDAQMVSADEIAFALLKWLEELLGCDASEASEDGTELEATSKSLHLWVSYVILGYILLSCVYLVSPNSPDESTCKHLQDEFMDEPEQERQPEVR